MPQSQNANPSLPSPFDVFAAPTPVLRPRFPRQRAQTAAAYRAACADRMAAWVRWVVDADPLIQPAASDDESMQRLKRTTAWRVLVRQAEIKAGNVTTEERALMARLTGAYLTQLEIECVSDVADRLADRATNADSSGYLVGPWVAGR